MTVSVLVAIRDRFSGRILEWYVAAQLLMWGMILLAPEESFKTSVVFVNFGVSEQLTGQIMLAVGVVRMGALIVNGAVPHVTPFVRLGGAWIGCGVWFYISVKFAEAGHISTWIAAWPMACLAEFVNMYRASQDARVGVSKVNSMQRAHGGRG